MRFHFAPEQKYDCVSCGRSCQAGWDIPVEEAVQQRIKDHVLTLRVIQERGAALRDKKPLPVLNMTPENPRCGYLEDDLLCGLHKQLGVHAKPNTCRLYPYILTQTPDGFFVGVAYSCTGARENAGRLLSLHADELQRLIEEGTAINIVPADGIGIHGSWFTRWSEYVRFEQELQQRAAGIGYREALRQGASGLAIALSTLAKPRTPSPRPLPEEVWLRLWQEQASLDGLASDLILELLPQLEGQLGSDGLSAFREGRGRLRVGLWEGNLSEWRALLLRQLPPELESEIERYLGHLVFRKQLVIHPTLLSNLILLSALPAFLRFYSHAFAGSEPVSLNHYWQALDVAEKYLVYHCRGLRSTYHKAARWAVERLRPVSGGAG